MERSKGFVVGEDEGVFKVRVQGGLYDGKKLRVASTQENCRLAPRLDVDFVLGTSQGRDEQLLVAVDVRPIEKVPKCDDDQCKADAEILMEVSGSDSRDGQYIRTCLTHSFQHMKYACTLPVVGRRMVKVMKVGEKQWRILVGVC
jgi:hypothetical protein